MVSIYYIQQSNSLTAIFSINYYYYCIEVQRTRGTITSLLVWFVVFTRELYSRNLQHCLVDPIVLNVLTLPHTHTHTHTPGAGRSSEVERSLMVRWVVGSSYFSFQPVPHDWCKKGRGMCYYVCGMMHIKEPLLLIGKSSLCGGSRFPLSLSGPLPYA